MAVRGDEEDGRDGAIERAKYAAISFASLGIVLWRRGPREGIEFFLADLIHSPHL